MQPFLTQEEQVYFHNQAVEALSAIVVDANVECAKMELDEGNNVEIRTYGVDRTTVEAYMKDFVTDVLIKVKERQSKL